jgi:hypothetical protein
MLKIVNLAIPLVHEWEILQTTPIRILIFLRGYTMFQLKAVLRIQINVVPIKKTTSTVFCQHNV